MPVTVTDGPCAPQETAAPRPRVALLDDARAWEHLPPTVRGGGGPLPAWARALASTLPRTTAAMLELDFLHRASSPLDPALRGSIRWVAAHANGCRYGEAYAEADLRRAGVDTAVLLRPADSRDLPPSHRAALAFADKLARSPQSITDAEVAELIGLHGEKQVVAMVLLVAYASFQDRLVLALDLPLEPGGPLEPLDIRFERPPPGAAPTAPARKVPVVRSTGRAGASEADPGWGALDFSRLRRELDRQRGRRPRIKIPATEGALWGLVCRTYQPELAAAWSACARSFGAEANQDPVFEESLFWVVTRSLQCFY